MSWSLVPAAKITRKASLVVGLSGLSGSGKTYSALLLAKSASSRRERSSGFAPKTTGWLTTRIRASIPA